MRCSRSHENQLGALYCVVCGEQLVASQAQPSLISPAPNPGFAPPAPQPVYPQNPYGSGPFQNSMLMGPPRNGKGTAALTLGILGLFLFPVIFSVLAIIFGSQGKKLADQGLATNRGAAQAGFVLGIIGLAIGLLLFFLILGA